jgi:mono/diheme cytochrome c family protein
MAGRWAVVFVLFALALGGCAPKPAPAPGPQGLYEQHCAKCHARAGEPGGPSIGGSRGPDLSHIGGNKDRNAEWFAKWIRDPKSVDPSARLMPAFKDTLTEEQIRELAEWLAAKK